VQMLLDCNETSPIGEVILLATEPRWGTGDYSGQDLQKLAYVGLSTRVFQQDMCLPSGILRDVCLKLLFYRNCSPWQASYWYFSTYFHLKVLTALQRKSANVGGNKHTKF
jgi:hypothetical protein